MPNPIERAIGLSQTSIATVFDWARHVFSPLSLVRESLRQNLQSDIGALFRRYWITPIVLTIFTDAVVLHFYGIEFKSDPPLTLLYFTFGCLKIVLEAFVLFGLLRLMRAQVTQGIAFVCFSIVVTYAPLLGWIGVPQAVHLYDVLAFLRSQHLSVTDTITFFVSHAKEINEMLAQPVPAIVPYLGMASNAVNLLSAMLVAECLAQILRLGRGKAYAATAIASALNLIPAMLLGLFQIALIFAYIQARS
jgi:hypothetical protein